MVGIYSVEFNVTGRRVQKAGFRSAVERIALDLGITGHAENREEIDKTGMKVFSVHIVAEGTEENLRAFIGRINKINTFHAVSMLDVESIFSSKKATPRRQYPEFSIIRSENEISERMDEAVHYMKDLYGETHSVKEEIHSVKEEIHSMKEETNSNFKTMEGKYHKISDNLTFFAEVVAEYVAYTKPELKGRIEEIKRQYQH